MFNLFFIIFSFLKRKKASFVSIWWENVSIMLPDQSYPLIRTLTQMRLGSLRWGNLYEEKSTDWGWIYMWCRSLFLRGMKDYSLSSETRAIACPSTCKHYSMTERSPVPISLSNVQSHFPNACFLYIMLRWYSMKLLFVKLLYFEFRCF